MPGSPTMTHARLFEVTPAVDSSGTLGILRQMQTPTIVFDHVNHVVTTLSNRPEDQQRLSKIVEAQRQLVATSGRSAA